MSWGDHRPTEVRAECPVCGWCSTEQVIDAGEVNGLWRSKGTAIGEYKHHHAKHHTPAPHIVYIARSDAEVGR